MKRTAYFGKVISADDRGRLSIDVHDFRSKIIVSGGPSAFDVGDDVIITICNDEAAEFDHGIKGLAIDVLEKFRDAERVKFI
jgi:hypothetical protein